MGVVNFNSPSFRQALKKPVRRAHIGANGEEELPGAEAVSIEDILEIRPIHNAVPIDDILKEYEASQGTIPSPSTPDAYANTKAFMSFVLDSTADRSAGDVSESALVSLFRALAGLAYQDLTFWTLFNGYADTLTVMGHDEDAAFGYATEAMPQGFAWFGPQGEWLYGIAEWLNDNGFHAGLLTELPVSVRYSLGYFMETMLPGWSQGVVPEGTLSGSMGDAATTAAGVGFFAKLTPVLGSILYVLAITLVAAMIAAVAAGGYVLFQVVPEAAKKLMGLFDEGKPILEDAKKNLNTLESLASEIADPELKARVIGEVAKIRNNIAQLEAVFSKIKSLSTTLGAAGRFMIYGLVSAGVLTAGWFGLRWWRRRNETRSLPQETDDTPQFSTQYVGWNLPAPVRMVSGNKRKNIEKRT